MKKQLNRQKKKEKKHAHKQPCRVGINSNLLGTALAADVTATLFVFPLFSNAKIQQTVLFTSIYLDRLSICDRSL